jgi:hypothetical protein
MRTQTATSSQRPRSGYQGRKDGESQARQEAQNLFKARPEVRTKEPAHSREFVVRTKNFHALSVAGPDYLGLWLEFNGDRLHRLAEGRDPITRELAMHIEESLDLPQGWMDKEGVPVVPRDALERLVRPPLPNETLGEPLETATEALPSTPAPLADKALVMTEPLAPTPSKTPSPPLATPVLKSENETPSRPARAPFGGFAVFPPKNPTTAPVPSTTPSLAHTPNTSFDEDPTPPLLEEDAPPQKRRSKRMLLNPTSSTLTPSLLKGLSATPIPETSPPLLEETPKKRPADPLRKMNTTPKGRPQNTPEARMEKNEAPARPAMTPEGAVPPVTPVPEIVPPSAPAPFEHPSILKHAVPGLALPVPPHSEAPPASVWVAPSETMEVMLQQALKKMMPSAFPDAAKENPHQKMVSKFQEATDEKADLSDRVFNTELGSAVIKALRKGLEEERVTQATLAQILILLSK